MSELRIELDACNPGQFYACCGALQLLELMGEQTLSRFEMDGPRHGALLVSTDREVALADIAALVCSSTFEAQPRPGAEASDPRKDALAPIKAKVGQTEFVLDWWLDEFHDRATSLKCWAGQLTSYRLFSTLPLLIDVDQPNFDQNKYATTRFGVDPRSAWLGLDIGYSLNEQGQDSKTFALVEMLAAIGLQGFRPTGTRADGFVYLTWHSSLPVSVARIATAEPWDGLAATPYRFPLSERGSYKFFGFAQPITMSQTGA